MNTFNLKFLAVLSVLINLSLANSVPLQMEGEPDVESHVGNSYISFEKFLEKSNEVNRLRKVVAQELLFLEETMAGEHSKEAVLAILERVRANYTELTEILGVFIPNQEMLMQLSTAFNIAACNEEELAGEKINHKRSAKSALLKRIYHKVPVIRNGRK